MKKNIMIAISLVALVSGTFFTGCKTKTQDTPEEGMLSYYEKLSDDLGIINVYDSSELTLENLQSRNGKIIIEKCIGIVTSPEGDGKILNYADPDQYYISYSRVENISVGDVILTYLIYNPDTNYEDDVIERVDYIIDDKMEN